MNIYLQDRSFANVPRTGLARALRADTLSWHAIGGPKRARIVSENVTDPFAYLNLLRYGVTVELDGLPVWWGYVHSVRAPGISVSLDGVYNSVAVRYGVLGAGDVVPTDSAITAFAIDTVSQAELGTLEYITEMEQADAATAVARRDLFLSQRSNPLLVPDSPGGRSVTLECRGWWDTLGMKGEEQPTAAGAIVQAVISDGGQDYDVGDVVDIDGGTGGQITITSVDDDPVNGVVTGFTLTAQGSGYSAGVTTTTHTAGTGLTVDIIAATGLSVDWTDLALGMLRDGYTQHVTNGLITSGGQGIPVSWAWQTYRDLIEGWMQIGYTDGRRGLSKVNSDRTVDIYPEPAESVAYTLDEKGILRDSTNRVVPPEKCTVGAWATLRAMPSVAGGIAVAKPWFIEEAEYSASSGATRYRAANTPDPFKLTQMD